MKKIIHSILNFLFPQKCFSCGEKNEVLCRECLAKIDMPSLPKEGNLYSSADYGDEIVKKAIWMLKYRKVKQLAEPLAELMHQRLPRVALGAKDYPWQIIPIPLSKKRLEERGYNQAELIANHLSQKISAPVISDTLVKTKDTSAQVAVKNRSERLKNLDGAFSIKNPEKIFGKNIILIDDVSTTGATIREAQKILKKSGAKKIICLVVARG